MRRIALALLSTTLLSGIAAAADLRAPVRGPAYSPPPPAYAHNWTGCFVGGSVGGLWATKDWTVNATDPFFTTGRPFGSHDTNSWLAGVQAGCDYQFAGGF